MKRLSRARNLLPDLPLALVLVALIGLLGLVLYLDQAEADRAQKPERARFMLECVADWQYAPETCEAILEGAPPPLQPDAIGEPGC